MSALPNDSESVEGELRQAARLTLLPQANSRISTLGFFAIIGVLVVAGLAVIMVTSTTVAAQSRELSALRREATILEYQAAKLGSDLQAISSTSSLAMRAADLGMVPNPYPAFLNLADGSILGEPTAVTGDEAGWLEIPRTYTPGEPHRPAAGVSQETSLPVGGQDGDDQ